MPGAARLAGQPASRSAARVDLFRGSLDGHVVMATTRSICVTRAALAALPLLIAGLAHAGDPPNFQTPHDTIPNFAANPTIQSVQNGAWSDIATWSPPRLPLASDVVRVGHAVAYATTTGTAAVVGIAAGASLRFATAQNTRLTVATLLVMPGGTLEIGTEAAPVDPGVTSEVVIRNQALAATGDPDQFGTGLLCVDGTLRIHGAPRTPTFVRLAQAPTVGATSFALAQPVSGWRAGDKLLLPDSDQPLTESSGVPHSYDQEEVGIATIANGGTTVTFAPALAFDHPGTTDEDNNGQPDFLPHVANRDRNVVIRSELRTGTRGHVFLTYKAHVDVRYAAFADLGRTTFDDLDPVTNRIGRYALHLHHLYGRFPVVDPEYQFRVVGNSVYDTGAQTPPQKWGIAIHDSHYGLVSGNVVYNIGGAGIVTEDGSESYNLFERNFVMRVLGNGGRSETDESGRGVAREGVGFWFRGGNNRVVDNVATNMIEGVGDIEAAYGFKVNMTYLGEVGIPNFRGADTSVPAQTTEREGNSLGLLEFSGNETYGQIQGLTLWWLCTEDFVPVPGCPHTVLADTVIWHTARYAYYGYPGYNYEFRRTRVYGDPDVAGGNNFEFKSVFFFGDYGTTDLLVTGHAMYNTIGLNPPYFRDGSIRVENSFFKTRAGIIHRKSGAPGSCPFCDLPDPDTIVTNNRFAPVGTQPLRTISLDSDTTDAANVDRLIVCSHNGTAGDHFEVFFPTQGNAPCSTTRPDVEGFVCVTQRAAAACNDLLLTDGFES